MELEALDDVGLTVADVSRSVEWYRDVLGLSRVHEETWGEFPAVLEANGSGVALFPRPAGHSATPDDPFRHAGFRTSRTGLESARTELRRRGISFDEGDCGIAWSIYLSDPDAYCVEITTYQPPVGAAG
jgi:catechol 2,3-dioxygenase-like lactoylglutathione lyase family enzyme